MIRTGKSFCGTVGSNEVFNPEDSSNLWVVRKRRGPAQFLVRSGPPLPYSVIANRGEVQTIGAGTGINKQPAAETAQQRRRRRNEKRCGMKRPYGEMSITTRALALW